MALRRRAGLARDLALSAYPSGSSGSTIDLVRLMYANRIPRSDTQLRKIFDGNMSLQTIAWALYQADQGAMRDLTDLGQDTHEMDPHLRGVLNKRWTAVAGIDPVLKPASGPGIDPEKAKFYCSVVQDQLAYLPNRPQIFRDLMWGLWTARSASELQWAFVPRGPMTAFGPIRYVLRDISWIHPRRITFGPHRELRIYDGSYQVQGFVEVGDAVDSFPWKFLSSSIRLWNDYPEREGLLRPCVHWSFFKRFGAKERMILLELFAKPWRWIEFIDKDAVVNPEDLDAADAIAEGLPGNSWGRFPRGLKLQTWMPPAKIDQHGDVIDMSDKQISKLVLGQTGTTDPIAQGFGTSQSKVMLSEQLMISIADAMWAAEVFEECVTDAIIALNFGEAEVTHAPTYRLPVALMTPAEEMAAVKQAVELGLAVPLTKAYEASRFAQPEEGEPYLSMEPGGTDPVTGVAMPGRIVVIYPEDEEEPEGGDDPAGAGGGAPPTLPANSNPDDPNPESLPGETPPSLTADDGAEDPALLAARKLARRMNEGEIDRCEHGKSNRCRMCGVERDRDYVRDEETGELRWVKRWRAIGDVDAPELEDAPEEEDEEPTQNVPQIGYGGIFGAVLRRPDVLLTIREEGGKWVVYSDDGEAKLGTYDTKEEAETRLKQVEEIKHAKGLTRKHFDRIARALDAVDADSVIRAVRFAGAGGLVAIQDRAPDNVRLAKQPESVNGSPEVIVDRFVRDVAPITERIGKKLVAATRGLTTARDIGRALNRASRDVSLTSLENEIEGELLHGQMLGAIDHYVERTASVEVAPEKFSFFGLLGEEEKAIVLQVGRVPILLAAAEDPAIRTNKNFAGMNENEAVKFFNSKEIMTKEEFELLEEGAKRRAFTVARLTNRSLLELCHAELGRMIAAGADLRDFAKFANERLISAGWVPASSSHVMTIARTNVAQAHSVGRLREMSKPEVLRDRPYWQIRGVSDVRQRRTHAKVNGVVLRASDSFWNKAFPPFGYQCRDRVVSLSDAQFEKRGLRLSDGGDITDVPDRGFRGSGAKKLLGLF